LVDGDIAVTIAGLDKIDALQPEVSSGIIAELKELEDSVHVCPSPSRTDVERSLRGGPAHDACGLTFNEADGRIAIASNAVTLAEAVLSEAFRKKIDVFLNTGVRELLEQGKGEPLIAELLTCDTNEALQAFFIKSVKNEPDLPGLINRYMKRIIIKKVRISDFKPKSGTIQKDQIASVAEEFKEYLTEQFADSTGDDSTLPVLQLE